ncbi:diguanylate cyclase [Glaciecola sp. SC05]|uniref:ligand-binding sensor domain-containing protein n=1 Tax=Glaciecola sp. SC05 TaxID=1987355 RepID=UPI0035297F90
MRIWLGVVLTFWVAAFAHSASIADALSYKRTYTQADGLSQATVYDIEQDLNGYIWLATQSGLDRFDGYSFVNFGLVSKDKQGLSSLRVLDIELEQSTGDLWVGTAGGLNLVDADTAEIQEISLSSQEGGKHKRFSAIHFDQQENMWIAADGELFVRRASTGTIEQINNQNAEQQTEIFELSSDANNIVYIATNNGIYRYHSDSDQWLSPLQIGTFMFSVFIDANGAVWAGSNGRGLYQFVVDNDALVSQQHVAIEQGLANNTIYDIEQDSSGRLWVATSSGLSIFEDPKILLPTSMRKDDSDSKSIVNSLYVTEADTIIYGTLTNGFSTVAPNALLFSRVHIPESKTTYSSALDTDEVLWVTAPEGLWKVGSDMTVLGLLDFEAGDENAGSTNTLMSIHHVKADDMLWIGTRAGLARLNEAKDSLVSVGFSGVPIYAIDSDEQGNLFIGTVTNGVYHYNPQSGEVLSHYKVGRPISFHVSSENKVWVATLEGLVKIDPILKTHHVYVNDPDDPKSLAHNILTWVSAYRENQYFVATQAKGLYLMTEDPLSNELSFEALFPDTEISSISMGTVVEGQLGNYWITTTRGIIKIDQTLSNIEFYDKYDGTSSGGYFIGPPSVNSSGRIFFAGSDGITHFHPSEVKRPVTKPPLHITAIEILNEDTGRREINADSHALTPIKEQTLMLSHSDIILSFEVAAIELFSPEKIEYTYRLIGFNDQWQGLESDKRSITYTSLNTGEYILEIKASNRYGQWLSEAVRLNIVVAPPWYFTKFAVVFWLLLAALAIYTYARWRSRSLYYRAEQLAAEVAIKTKDLKKANDKLRLLSNLDPLTQIFNRRGFTYEAKKYLKNAGSGDSAFCIVLFDLDYFKRINDGFGHDVGDEVLVSVAAKIESELGADDVFGRWGGEEFILLLRVKDLGAAVKFADNIRRVIAKKPFEAQGIKANVTLSGGLALLDKSSTIDIAIKKADVMLYQAKQNGRNQICSSLI